MKLVIEPAPFNPYALKPSGLKHWRVLAPGWSWFIDSAIQPTPEQAMAAMQAMADMATGAATTEKFAKAAGLPLGGPADVAIAKWAFRAYSALAEHLAIPWSGPKVGATVPPTRSPAQVPPPVPPKVKVTKTVPKTISVAVPPPLPKADVYVAPPEAPTGMWL